jgi:N-acetylglutamate synthase-like GNAT family acetyltransferase
MKVRRASGDELEEVFLMGYDAWGGGLPEDMYLESCLASYKYKQGEFFVLESADGELLSSCIVYPLSAFGGVVSERSVGVGSLCTLANQRHKGYATLFLALLMKQLETEGVDAFFIHSDINPRIYENLGFQAAPESCRDPRDGTVPMLRLSGDRNVTPELWRELVMPEYF